MPNVLIKSGLFEFEEKRSKFIGFCATVKTEDDVRRVLCEIRNEYKNATHYVYAFALSENNTTRFSDDGEPRGTGGMPVLNVFQKSNVIEFICVVIRYFGGTLLGSGGLVRAYTKAAKGAMENAGITELVPSKLYRISCSYANLESVKYNFNKWNIEILNITYTDQCEAVVNVQDKYEEPFKQGTGYVFEEILRNHR